MQRVKEFVTWVLWVGISWSLDIETMETMPDIETSQGFFGHLTNRPFMSDLSVCSKLC
ncbi:hypothetical protein DPMN_090133, partial [Dreissena polymorpha]